MNHGKRFKGASTEQQRVREFKHTRTHNIQSITCPSEHPREAHNVARGCRTRCIVLHDMLLTECAHRFSGSGRKRRIGAALMRFEGKSRKWRVQTSNILLSFSGVYSSNPGLEMAHAQTRLI